MKTKAKARKAKPVAKTTIGVMHGARAGKATSKAITVVTKNAVFGAKYAWDFLRTFTASAVR